MRSWVAQVSKSYVPVSIGVLGAVSTALAIQVGDQFIRESEATWERWCLALGIALLGFSISFLLSQGTLSLIKRYVKAVERAKFLQEFAEFLSRSLDFETGLGPLAALLTPRLADQCLIDIVEPGGRVKRTTSTAHVTNFDLSRFEILHQDPKIFDDGSGLIVPMLARDRVFGTLTLLWTERNETFKPEDLTFVSDVARRAALALDNARLFGEASRANRMKDEFLTTLSHELRTPMNVILGWLDVLTQEDCDQETYEQALATLTRNAKMQMQLIDDLLDVSRVTNGKLTLSVANDDASKLVSEAVQSILPAARAKELEVDFAVGLGDHSVMVDSDRIHQVLWNLLSNAVKFTAPGGRLTVRVESDFETTRILIRDTGQGIDPDFLPHVFDRFRQEDGTITRGQSGLGIGLSIAAHLVELHGGEITAHSDGRGQGAEFMIALRRSTKISERRPSESWISAEI